MQFELKAILTISTTVTVEADNEEEAVQKALDLDWVCDGRETGDLQDWRFPTHPAPRPIP